jgi:endonuclease YncB( thermonuclease family)
MTSDHLRQQLISIFLLSILLLANNCQAASMQGQVVEIISAERITIKSADGKRREIKLIGIRIPNLNRRERGIAKRHLGMLLAGRYINVEYTTLSSRGVILGTVLHGGSDIALRMLSDGLAIAVDDPRLQASRLRRYEQAEASARTRGLGFWQTSR